VVSGPLNDGEFADLWLAGDGAVLARRTATLVAEALDVAMRWEVHEADTAAIPWATYRYVFGDREHMERAQRVAADCFRSVLRTLRPSYIVTAIEAGYCVEPAPGAGTDLPAAPPQ